MAFSLHYLDVVKIDIKSAKDWYKQQRPGLENTLLPRLKTALAG